MTTDFLLNVHHLEVYFQHLRKDKQFKPTTLAEKLRRIKTATQFIVNEEDHELKNDALYIRGSRIIEKINKWIASLSKMIGKQRQQHGLKVCDEIASAPARLPQFLSKEVFDKVQVAIHNLQTSFRPKDIKLLTAYAASILIYKNAQRSGVIQHLTIEEFNSRKQTKDGKTVIPCINHKTGAHGRAHLVVEDGDETVLLQYLFLVREKITPNHDCQNLFFLTHTGAQYTQVYRKVCESIRENNLKIDLPPPPGSFRIQVSTKATKTIKNSSTHKKIIKHLSHSTVTSEKYYEFVNINDAAEAYDEINKLIHN